MKPIFLRAILLLLWANPVRAAGLAERVRALSESDDFKDAQWAVSVRDAATGKDLVRFNGDKNMIPGSILKLFVAAAALEALGPEHRFRTGLYMADELSRGTLRGSLRIRGGGDPSFGSSLVPGAASIDQNLARWLTAVQSAGIRKIKGSVVVDNSLFEGPPLPGSWEWQDIGNYYGAQPTALVVGDNLYELYFRPGARVDDPATIVRTEPPMDGMSFQNFMRTGLENSGDNGYIFNFPGQYSAVVRGTVPRGPAEFAIKGAIPDPPLYLARRFAAYLAAHGISVSSPASKISEPTDYAGFKLLDEIQSPPLKDIVSVMNKRSFNLYAEVLLRQLAVAKGARGTLDQGIAALKGFLSEQGIDGHALRLVDACGMSRGDLVRASDFTAFLGRIARKPYFQVFWDSLVSPADPDATGHIQKMGVNTRLQTGLKIKSGSLNGVRGYAGYLDTRRGRRLAFTFIINNYSAPSDEIEKVQEQLLLDLADRY